MTSPNLITTHQAVLGALLGKLRASKGKTQAEVADMLKLTSSTWSRIEKGDSGLSVEQLRRVGNFLEVPAAEILRLAAETTASLEQRGITVEDRWSEEETNLLKETGMAQATGTMFQTGWLPLAGAALAGVVGALGVVEMLKQTEKKK